MNDTVLNCYLNVFKKNINCTYQQSVSKEEMSYWYCSHLPQLKMHKI